MFTDVSYMRTLRKFTFSLLSFFFLLLASIWFLFLFLCFHSSFSFLFLHLPFLAFSSRFTWGFPYYSCPFRFIFSMVTFSYIFVQFRIASFCLLHVFYIFFFFMFLYVSRSSFPFCTSFLSSPLFIFISFSHSFYLAFTLVSRFSSSFIPFSFFFCGSVSSFPLWSISLLSFVSFLISSFHHPTLYLSLSFKSPSHSFYVLRLFFLSIFPSLSLCLSFYCYFPLALSLHFHSTSLPPFLPFFSVR